ncbi:MAG: S-layer homology domain-containing protein [Acidobacteriota bacterium]|nr:S-layer homology domain-containing protein [Acidobacteriota bacterium]
MRNLFLIALVLFFCTLVMGQGFDFPMPFEEGDGYTITTPINGDTAFHRGIMAMDIVSGKPDAAILAVASGTIVEVRFGACHGDLDVCYACEGKPSLSGIGQPVERDDPRLNHFWGNVVVIDHGNGYRTRYAHLRCIGLNTELKVGDSIKKGDPLGRIGTSGWSTAVHLHFQVYWENDSDHELAELQTVTMEGQPLAFYTDGYVASSSNRPGLEFVTLEHHGFGDILNGAGVHQGGISYTLRNNDVQPVIINRVTLWGESAVSSKEQLGSQAFSLTLQPGGSVTQSTNVSVTLPRDFVGFYTISATLEQSNGDLIVSGRGTRIMCLTDEQSFLVDNDHPSFPGFDITPDSKVQQSSGGFNGSLIDYSFSNEGFTDVLGTWKPPGLTEGKYEILAYIPFESTKTKYADYRIVSFSTAKQRKMVLTRRVPQRDLANVWYSLGTFPLKAPHAEVQLRPTNLGGNYRVGYDAMLFRRVAELDDFDDNPIGTWFYEAVSELQRLGIVQGRGVGQNLFQPSEPVTRAETLKIVLASAWTLKLQAYELFHHGEGDPEETMRLVFADDNESFPPFTDVAEGTWPLPYVALAYKTGLIDRTQATYRPDDATLRVEALKLIIDALGFDLDDGINQTLTFTDIDRGEWYAPYLRLAFKHKIATGYDEALFKPGEPINRAEAAVMMYRALSRYAVIPKLVGGSND